MPEPGPRAELRELVASVVGDDGPEPFGVYVFHGGDPAAEIARTVEREVFLEAFNNTPELLAAEYGPYEATSLFCCVIDRRRKLPAGMIRLIVPAEGGPGLKSLNDVARDWGRPATELWEESGLALSPGAVWDYATLAVAPEYRTAAATGLVSLALHQASILAPASRGMDATVAILDRAVYRMSLLRYHGPFVPYTLGRPYLGSRESLPVVLDLARWEEILAGSDPVMHDIMYAGTGIEAAVRPLDLALTAVLADSIGAPRRPVGVLLGPLAQTRPHGAGGRAAAGRRP